MKKSLFGLLILVMVMFVACAANAQKPVKLDSMGNYVSSNVFKEKIVDETTGKFFVDTKGVKYPIYRSSNSKMYYLKTAKSGNIYKVYLKL